MLQWTRWKSLCCLFGTAGMVLSVPAFADRCQHCGGESLPPVATSVYQCGEYEEITQAIGPAPALAGGVSPFFQVEPLFWRMAREGGAYGVHGFKTGETTTSKYQPAPPGRVEFIGSKWEPGFKAGVGVCSKSGGWSVFLQHTYFHLKWEGQELRSAYMRVPFLTNFTSDPGFEDVATGAKATQKVGFNVLDLRVGQDGFWGSCLILSPYVGVKAARLKESDYFLYLGDTFALGEKDIATAASGPYYAHYGRNVFGVGLRCGCGFSWLLSRGFSIYGDFSWAVLWTDCYAQRRVDTLRDVKTVAQSENITDTVVININNRHHNDMKSLCEFECGLSWEACLCGGDRRFEARLGWVEQVWVNWVENWNLLAGAYSNLSLHGPGVTLRFAF